MNQSNPQGLLSRAQKIELTYPQIMEIIISQTKEDFVSCEMTDHLDHLFDSLKETLTSKSRDIIQRYHSDIECGWMYRETPFGFTGRHFSIPIEPFIEACKDDIKMILWILFKGNNIELKEGHMRFALLAVTKPNAKTLHGEVKVIHLTSLDQDCADLEAHNICTKRFFNHEYSLVLNEEECVNISYDLEEFIRSGLGQSARDEMTSQEIDSEDEAQGTKCIVLKD